MRVASILGVMCLAVPGAAQTVQLSGTVQYTDREYDINGFTGVNNTTPVRFAWVEVVDVSTGNVRASAETDANGAFAINFTNPSGNAVRVRVLASSTSHLVEVRNPTVMNSPIWAQEIVPATVPPPIWNVGTLTAPLVTNPLNSLQVGSPLDMLEQMIRGIEFLSTLEPVGNPPSLGGGTVIYVDWPASVPTSAYQNQIYVEGNDGCDDSVVLHEFGHVVMWKYGQDDSPGGAHTICDSFQDPRLSWSEGWATAWSSYVRKMIGESDPSAYVDTTGGITPPALGASFRIEDQSDGTGPTTCDAIEVGPASELAVACGLWDLVDEPGDMPNSMVDDDLFDGSVQPGGISPMLAVWRVMRNRMHDVPIGLIPTTDAARFAYFWDGWSAEGYLDDRDHRDRFVALMQFWQLERVVWVDPANATGIEDGSETYPYTTIPAAVTAAPKAGKVRCAPGHYPGYHFVNKDVLIERKSTPGPNVVIGS